MHDYKRSVPRRARNLTPKTRGAPPPAACPNDVWAIDAKGLWRGIDPLSVIDVHSRYALDLTDVPINTVEVQRVTGKLFDKHGPPRRIRCDGGPPFGSYGVAKLTRLVVWWLDLGIVVEHVECAQHNGHVERFHRTIEQEASHDVNVAEALRDFRDTYNELRPHEMLQGRVPSEVYRPRPLEPTPFIVPRYDDERLVFGDGSFKWGGERIYISDALCSRTITFRALEKHLWLIRYLHIPLALFNERRSKLQRLPPEIVELQP
ncbi:MAG: integrase core domain-containing protein [Brevundimonas sp.]|nr:integrase core domain-containing protein [Brevundimonas sp.]